MDKNAIKKFAVWARTELIIRVSQKCEEYGIKEDSIVDASSDSINGKVLSKIEKEQRIACIAQIDEKGYKQVIEEVAYTWFNRFSALRFMEVNGYLPSRVRVFTDMENNFKPQILTEAIHLNLDGLDKEKVFKLKEEEKTEELYKYLLIVQCNALNKILPGMFQKISDYTELLLPDNLLRDGSVIQQMIELIPEDDWKDAVQIIGWLYQYYNSQKKDDVFAALKKNVKITKENIPAATQLFTPDWIVRYMVENSLGRLWVEGHPETKDQLLPTEEEQLAYVAGNRDPEDTKWHYYLEEAKQEPEVQAQLAEIRKEYAMLTPEQLKVIDPCCGSGHILAYMFDVLMQIYSSYGYTTREAVESIIENNIYGLDIDDRAAQLAYFAVMMKARQYDHRFFSRKDEDGNLKVPQPHVHEIVESGHTDKDGTKKKNYDIHALEYFCNGDDKLKNAMDTIISELHDAKEYGSILTVTQQNWPVLYNRFAEIEEDVSFYMFKDSLDNELLRLVQVAEALAQKYDVVVTNPPYMGGSGMSAKLSNFVKKNFPDSKSDLFAVFIEKCGQMAKKNGYQAMITQHAWMFLSSFEKLRVKLLNMDIVNMAHLGARAFEEIGGEVVQTTSFVIRKSHIVDYKGEYCRLIEPTTQQGKADMFLIGKNRYESDQSDFSKIPGSPMAYWISKKLISNFTATSSVGKVAKGKVGLQTGSNDVFLRFWFELQFQQITFTADKTFKWYPYNKGGGFRRWYGNSEYVLNWNADGYEIKAYKGAYPRNTQYYFREGLTWSDVATGLISMRRMPTGYAFDTCAPCLFASNPKTEIVLLALFNSKVAQKYMDLMSPTMHYTCGTLVSVPFIEPKFDYSGKVQECISISKIDWDSFETSWDFQRHPLLQCATFSPQMIAQEEANGYPVLNNMAEAYRHWEQESEERFNQLKSNEEELNRIFIDIYGLQDELTPEVEDKDVTVRKADLGRDIRSFISYAVGCMFGRYSLDVDGLAYAGGEYSEQWVAISGQYYKREMVEYYVSKELSRAFGMAEIYVGSGGNISIGENASERGVICLIGPDAESSSVDPVKYRRGTSKKLYEGICTISLDCKRLDSGIGNTVYDLCSPEILTAVSNGNSNGLVERGWNDAERIDWQAVYCSLTAGHYAPDKDNIIPICDDEYFEDDIVNRFVEFVKTVYGAATLDENLKFIADALGGKGQPKDVIRNYFLNDFYTDHCKIYQKRPIYWLFDSGKKNGFKVLIYMHRYQPDTIARIRTDYVHEQQARYRTAIADLEQRMVNASTGERVKLNKKLTTLQAQDTEIRTYEEKIHHLADQMISIDLDDGVKKNYAIFQDVLAKIK